MRFFLCLCLIFVSSNLLLAQPVTPAQTPPLFNATFEPNANNELVLKGWKYSDKAMFLLLNYEQGLLSARALRLLK